MNQWTVYKVFENKVVDTNFEPSFFNTSKYVQFHTPKRFLSFGLFESVTDTQSKIIFNIFLDNNLANSPYRAPFGSIECSTQTTENELIGLMKYVINHLKSLQIHSLTIVNYPNCMHDNSHIIHKIFLKCNFQITQNDYNQHLQISDMPFEKIIRPDEKRRLRKCETNQFQATFNPCFNVLQMFEFIQHARDRKNYPLNIDYQTLNNAIKLFPENYLIFTTFLGDELAASAIAVKVSSKVLYYYLSADSEKYLSFSPAIAIVKSIYNYAQLHGYEILDLGISSLTSIKNEGLYNFKKNLGAVDSSKYQYRLVLE